MSAAPNTETTPKRDHRWFSRIAVACWCVVGLVAISSAVGLLLLGSKMAPVKRGSVEQFWKSACGVDLTPAAKEHWAGNAFFVDDKWAAYEISNLHGSKIYSVPADEATARFNEVVASLNDAKRRGVESWFVEGFVAWQSSGDHPNAAKGLLDHIRVSMQKARFSKDPDLLANMVASEQQFYQRWQRANWYWANYAFEWLFLCGLALFAVWPGIRRKTPIHWAIHAAALPILFLMPTYLGYATFTFTSAGPSGGILYPYLIVWFRHGSLNSFEQWLLERLPQILEPLSTPIGSPMALTGMGLPGPSSALITGVALATIVLLIGLGDRRWKARRSNATPN